MDDNAFAELKAQIDAEIATLPASPSGIKMGFGLAGQFLVRGLLTLEVVDMILCRWEMRAYRGRYIYPDPTLGEYDYIVGRAH